MEDLCTPVSGSSKIAAYSMPLVNPVLTIDSAANDSDKTIVVPANKLWQVQSIYVTLATSVKVGTRILLTTFNDDSDNIIYEMRALNIQLASCTEYYIFSQGFSLPTENTASYHFIPIPPALYLNPGFYIRIYDQAVQDPTVDDLIIRLMANEIPI